eukprot:CAMPEP_0183400266 /NCGR_PEP_ID=MMETSP0370-20130417/12486_1 /TAXON_ID=268820 /ORGANISM="Peridinium aciculiferum, Strain PAER-2" /LENGTH=50 /DNA_ID=CAMNT_0025581549 /DNA_START=8 /DNA_END=163 /DNA_ORIENTATION=+
MVHRIAALFLERLPWRSERSALTLFLSPSFKAGPAWDGQIMGEANSLRLN